MNRTPPNDDRHWEADAVWSLLDESPPTAASARFVESTVRAARTLEKPTGWWQRMVAPLPAAAFATTAAAVVTLVFFLQTPPSDDAAPVAIVPAEDSFAAIQEVADAEALIAAIDHMDEFSDHELASLIGL